MNRSHQKRLEEIERQVPSDGKKEPVFWDRPGQMWTEKQKKWIQKRYPDCRFFIKPLSPTMPYGYERKGQEAVAWYKDLCSLVDWEADKKLMDEQVRACRAEYEKQKTDNGGRG